MEKSEMATAHLSLLVLILLSFHVQIEVLAFTTPSDNDYSYMKFVYNATVLPLKEENGDIVIGGGTAGCNPIRKLLGAQALLDAGVGPDNGLSVNHMIGTKVSGSTFDELGRRHGAVELLNRANFKNLRVVVHSTVDRITFCPNAASFLLYLALFFNSLPFSLFPTPPSSPNLNLASIVEKPPGPSSHGYLRLSFLIKAKIDPRVQFNYFSHPTDLSRCIRTMRKLGEMLETKSMD
ncbi:hypothetical protein TIFTF001_031881 [Ficus carica]|uniref:Uncharacterized protein n=1 Tax=Ficus carica TaxID=3494 RepID=A0AA88J1P0_FICCA|nr:hypothetical protein TIFTF001_031881 [Ficus carica]